MAPSDRSILRAMDPRSGSTLLRILSRLSRSTSFVALALIVTATALGLIGMHSIAASEPPHAHPAAVAEAPLAHVADDATCEDCGHHAGMVEAMCALGLLAIALMLVEPRLIFRTTRPPASPAVPWRWVAARVAAPTLHELSISRT